MGSSDLYLQQQKELEERTIKLALDVIKFCNKLPFCISNQAICAQLVRAISSIGANYREACEPESRKDFIHKIAIAKKEAKESLYWLELLAKTNEKFKDEIRPFYKETRELIFIFSKSICTSRKNTPNKN